MELASRQDSRKPSDAMDPSPLSEMTHADPTRERTLRRKGNLWNAAPSGDLRITWGGVLKKMKKSGNSGTSAWVRSWGWGRERGKERCKMTPCGCAALQRKPKTGPLAAWWDHRSRGAPRWPGHCRALELLPSKATTLWSFGEPVDPESQTPRAEAGSLPSWAHCRWRGLTVRGHIGLWVGAGCAGSPSLGIPCFGVQGCVT